MTAFVSGTENTPLALYDRLLTELTTNADLVAAGEEWAAVWTHPDGATAGTVLRGTGLAGQDNVFLGFRLLQDAGLDSYSIEMIGMTGVVESALTWRDHANVTPQAVRLFVDNITMGFWLAMNGRRFTLTTKQTTVYESMYGGLFLPYANPQQYRYPLFIGGSAGEYLTTSSPISWRDVSASHSHYVDPYNTAPGASTVNTSAWLLAPNGTWRRVVNKGNANVDTCYIHPNETREGLAVGWDDNTTYAPDSMRPRMIQCYGGEHWLMPLTIVDSRDSLVLGVLEGCYKTQGLDQSVENVITVDGVDHLVVQNAFRTTTDSYWAMRMS